MTQICAPLLAGLAAALLAACATQPVPAETRAAPEAVSDTLKNQAVSVAVLSPDDPGIAALARAVSGADLVSFEGGGLRTREDAALKSALTEALVQSGKLSLLLLDVPCDGAAVLNEYTRGGATSTLAADLVREAPIYQGQKSTALADMLTLLRGWNAVNADQPVRVAGMQCASVAEADPARLAIFWGLDQLPAHTGEKDMAAAARDGEPADNPVFIVQTDDAAVSSVIPASGWIDLRALPASADVAAWREETASALPLLRQQHPSAADILFRHAATTPAEPF
ncbi:hypothetical protein HNE_0718 [Hyphomonas neptunium ATCC 15444]|uniref:Lipoprotein n=2 Tax=Hyphomonas TaxID=85 RepID=Q0C497_HYPNA|nr:MULTISPECIES: hypothetical protein [Hyphomonas]ABI76329.1 hypothetical protein HNE_0718 [Hyphomonas neptunium ATCC 15444]KCZ96340.1 hypothetical protein HHI_01635 [Hyphomonas hirschiana VP5]